MRICCTIVYFKFVDFLVIVISETSARISISAVTNRIGIWYTCEGVCHLYITITYKSRYKERWRKNTVFTLKIDEKNWHFLKGGDLSKKILQKRPADLKIKVTHISVGYMSEKILSPNLPHFESDMCPFRLQCTNSLVVVQISNEGNMVCRVKYQARC